MGTFRNGTLLTNQLLSHLIYFPLCSDFLSKILKTMVKCLGNDWEFISGMAEKEFKLPGLVML